MKKRIVYIVGILFVLLTLTGCVKMNVNMDIKKNKNMDFSMIIAMDESLMDGEDAFADIKDESENNGYKVTKYEEGTLKGYKLTKTFKNIDKISSTEDVKFYFSEFDEVGENGKKMFKVKKGFLKNRYTAKIEFDFDNQDFVVNPNNNQFAYNDDDWSFDLDDDDWSLDWDDDDWSFDWDDDDWSFDWDENTFGEYFKDMFDLKYKVSLPYAVISSNATKVSENKKELEWNLDYEGPTNVEFEFELWNLNTIFIIGGVGLLVIIGVIVALVPKKPKQKQNVNNSQPMNQEYTQQPQPQPMNQQYTQQPQPQPINQQYTQQPQPQPMNQQYTQQPQPMNYQQPEPVTSQDPMNEQYMPKQDNDFDI